MKTINPGLSEIQREAMLPLTNLFESNFNYYQINQQIIKGKFVPDFRYKALEDKYVEHMEKLCGLLRDYGDLRQPFDIRQMLLTLKSKDWENIHPHKYYFQPLKDAVDKMQIHILDLNRLGFLRSRYVMKENAELMKRVIHSVACDQTSQWVGANQLRRDQLKFVYDIMKKMFDSPLREFLVEEKNGATIISDAFPQYLSFHALMT